MLRYAWLLWVGIAIFYVLIAMDCFSSLRRIKKELSTLSTEGGFMWSRRRDLALKEAQPLNLGQFFMAQLRSLQWSGFLGAVAAVAAAVVSLLVTGI